jgi:hypothetical protein
MKTYKANFWKAVIRHGGTCFCRWRGGEEHAIFGSVFWPILKVCFRMELRATDEESC